MIRGCLCHCKGTNFLANHNTAMYAGNVSLDVYATAKVLIFQQITTPASSRPHGLSMSKFRLLHNILWNVKKQGCLAAACHLQCGTLYEIRVLFFCLRQRDHHSLAAIHFQSTARALNNEEKIRHGRRPTRLDNLQSPVFFPKRSSVQCRTTLSTRSS